MAGLPGRVRALIFQSIAGEVQPVPYILFLIQYLAEKPALAQQLNDIKAYQSEYGAT